MIQNDFRYTRALCFFSLLTVMVGATGCDDQVQSGTALSDFIVSFARQLLSAFLL